MAGLTSVDIPSTTCSACGANAKLTLYADNVPFCSPCFDKMLTGLRERAERAEAERDEARAIACNYAIGGPDGDALLAAARSGALLEAAGIPVNVPNDPDRAGPDAYLDGAKDALDAYRRELRRMAEEVLGG